MSPRIPRRSPLLLEGRVRGLGRQGEGAVETGEGIVFVAGALPQERVRFRLQARRRGALRGELVAVLEPSELRVEPPCALASRCGGCPAMHLSSEGQRELKREWVVQATAAFASQPLEMAIEPSASNASPLGYRRRARLAFDVRGQQRRLGYRPSQSAEVVDVVQCVILEPVLQGGLQLVRERLLPHLAGSGELWLAPSSEERVVVWLHARAPQSTALYDALRDLVEEPRVAGATLKMVDGHSTANFGDPRQQVVAADGHSLWGPPYSFSQSNRDVNDALARWVLEAAAPAGQRVVELFCGHGNLTVLLSRDAGSYYAVEMDGAAIEACRENLVARGIDNVHLAVGDAAGYRGPAKADVVVMDPPRTGAREVVGTIGRLNPQRIVYVSCDPATLRRDLGLLQAQGFAVEAARAFDMFPQTTHVEAAVLLCRTGIAGSPAGQEENV